MRILATSNRGQRGSRIGSHWVSVGGVMLLLVVAILTTLFAGILVLRGSPVRFPMPEAEHTPQSIVNPKNQ